MATDQYIGFKLGSEEYAIPILTVQEIITPSKITTVPEAPPYIEGMLNLRDRVIPIVNLKMKMGIRDEAGSQNAKVVVINIGSVKFGGKVDAITGVISIDDDKVEPPDALLTGNDGSHITGVAKLDGRLVIILSLASMLSINDVSLLSDDVVDIEKIGDDEVIITKKVSGMGGDVLVKEVKRATDVIVNRVGETGKDTKIVMQIMENVQSLLDAISSGSIEKAEEHVEELSRIGEKELFTEIGRVTRKLHNAIKEFKETIDPRLKNMAVEEIPEATDKLEWVIAKTEDAASRTISLVEKHLSLQEKMAKRISRLERLVHRVGDAKDEDKEALKFLKDVNSSLSNDLMEVLLAQDFQDLTGQIIKKVIKLVSDMETQLVKLVQVFGVKLETPIQKEELHGPQIAEREGFVSGQSDVDDILKEFGF